MNIQTYVTKVALAGSVALGALAISTTAFAQEAAKPADAVTTDDIIVTARRSAERLQDVPVAVTAFGAEGLSDQRIVSEVSLQQATPGLTVRATTSSNQLNYSIRGQSIDSFSYSAPAVLPYFNEVPTNGTSATAFFDLESIQVLKGPQGTLFGRNATGGAVLYQSAAPKDDAVGGYLKGSFGRFNDRSFEAAVNLPLTEGFAFRVAGKYEVRDGFQHNLYNDTYLGKIDNSAIRASLLIAPSGSGFENITVAQYGRYRGTSVGLKMQNANGVNGAPSTYVSQIDGSTQPLNTSFAVYDVLASIDPRIAQLGFTGISDFLTKQKGIGFWDVYNDRSDTHRATQKFLSNKTTYELTDDIQVKNIFGYNKVFSFDPTDVDGSPYQWLTIGHDQPFTDNSAVAPSDRGYNYGTKQWSNELQLSGEVGHLKFIAGAFVSVERTYVRIPLAVLPDTIAAVNAGRYEFNIRDKSTALFAQATYAILDNLNLTGGIRYTWEDLSLRHTAISNLPNGFAKRKDSKPSWLVSVDYKITPDLMIYASHRGSWRTGGFNGTSNDPTDPSLPSRFEPETTFDFEIGAKYSGMIGARRARLNVAIYDQYIKDVQRAPYVGIAAVGGNVGKARVTGFEGDAMIEIADFLDIGGAFTYTKARYTDPIATVPTSPAQVFYFGPYADTPKTSGSAYFRAHMDLDNQGGELALRGDAYSQASFYYSNTDRTTSPGTKLQGYTLFNIRAEWNEVLGTDLSLAAFVQNLTNEKYYSGGIALSAVFGSNAALVGTPRIWGMEVGYKF
jgi:iron complex outermembrane receptor protein